MTTEEFSNEFEIRVDSYRRMKDFDSRASFDSIEFDEYEKSLFLTKAQRDFVVNYYSGKNEYSLSFEEKELVREALDTLVETFNTSTVVTKIPDISDSKHTFTFFGIPASLLWILYEEAHYAANTGCVCADGKYVEVIPTTHDELHRRLRNPFRGPRRHRVLRLNVADNLVELISDYPIGSYTLRYVKEPQPIILTDLTDNLTIQGESEAMTCSLPDITHEYILDAAVRLALQSKLVGVSPQGK